MKNATSQANNLLPQHAIIKFGEPTIDLKRQQKRWSYGTAVQWINFQRLVYVYLLIKWGR